MDDLNEFEEEDYSAPADENERMMREWVAGLPEQHRSMYTMASMRRLRSQGISAKQFMWMSEAGKLEALGVYVTNKSLDDYEE